MVAADHLAELLGKPLSQVNRSGKLLAEGFLKAQKLYSSDFIIIFADVYVEAEAMGVKLQYFEDKNPQIIETMDYETIEPVEIAVKGGAQELLFSAEACKGKMGDDFTIFVSMKDPFSLAAMIIGVERFLGDLVFQPEKARSAIKICEDTQQDYLSAIINKGFIPLIGAPIASGSILGEKHFRDFALKPILNLFTSIKLFRSYRCMHICGSLKEIVNPLAELGLDILSFEDYIPELWEKAPTILPMGNVPTELFLGDDAEPVIQARDRCYKEFPIPFILSTACDLPAKANPKLVQAMMSDGHTEG
jgi:uroporphyrinogen decarboxylase